MTIFLNYKNEVEIKCVTNCYTYPKSHILFSLRKCDYYGTLRISEEKLA